MKQDRTDVCSSSSVLSMGSNNDSPIPTHEFNADMQFNNEHKEMVVPKGIIDIPNMNKEVIDSDSSVSVHSSKANEKHLHEYFSKDELFIPLSSSRLRRLIKKSLADHSNKVIINEEFIQLASLALHMLMHDTIETVTSHMKQVHQGKKTKITKELLLEALSKFDRFNFAADLLQPRPKYSILSAFK